MKIHNLFTPTQPTVKQRGQQVSYQELTVSEVLRPYLYCYWELKTTSKLDHEFVYTVVADGCIDIFFEIKSPKLSFVMGFCTKYTEFEIGNQFRYIGVRFFPTMFPQLFNIDASKLSNKFQKLDAFLPQLSSYIANRIHEEQSPEDIKCLFDAYFHEHLRTVELNFDPRFYNALEQILKSHGTLKIETDLITGLSPRQLRRIFNYYLGTSPKRFGKVVRFQNILRAKPSTNSLNKNKLFFSDGYYDQAHYIKEFKNFYGVTPSKAFKY